MYTEKEALSFYHFRFCSTHEPSDGYRSEMVAVLGPDEALPYYIHTYIHTSDG
jgi:hypothetical protein